MSELSVEASICEIGGPYYQVLLHTVPRVGELIDLWSLIDQGENLPPVKHYEVVQVVHKMQDVSKKIRQPTGAHSATVFVRRSKSDFFGK